MGLFENAVSLFNAEVTSPSWAVVDLNDNYGVVLQDMEVTHGELVMIDVYMPHKHVHNSYANNLQEVAAILEEVKRLYA
jgi:hypothetical protein